MQGQAEPGGKVHLVVLAGGAGTRFWPASRASRPKQLLPLAGPEPLIRRTALRLLELSAWERVLVAGGRAAEAGTRALLPEVPPENVLVEPVPRNTAPCIGWAAARIARSDPDALVVVVPSDQHVVDVEGYRAAVRAALADAAEGHIVTIGIPPTRPETGFGYIELGGPVEAGPPRAVDARRFVEKPSRERAEEMLATGRFVWNAGMFVFRARDMLAALRAHLPALADGLARFDAAAREGREAEVVLAEFGALPSISVDHGVMEKLPALRVVPADVGWSDLGSFQAVWELAARDEQGNALPPDALAVEARGNVVLDLREGAAPKKVIALLGVDDLVVVETDDALLVTRRDRSQDVRLVVDAVKARGGPT